MARTVSNAKRNIVTKGSAHVAVAIAADLLYTPDRKVVGLPNHVKSDKLRNGTTKTFIAGHSIWTKAGQLGPPSLPAHPSMSGTRSGTNEQEAEAVTYSRNVFMEGNAAVRAYDFTKQNHKNTDGIVLPAGAFALLNGMANFDGYCLADAAQFALPWLLAAGKL
jgi:hypothetical protein